MKNREFCENGSNQELIIISRVPIQNLKKLVRQKANKKLGFNQERRG